MPHAFRLGLALAVIALLSSPVAEAEAENAPASSPILAFPQANASRLAQAPAAPTDGRACLPHVADRAPTRLAALHAAVPPVGKVRVTFLGHSSFLIETPGGASLVTDYNGYVNPAAVPDIVTMNRSHRSHYTDSPDRRIPHVLPGWDPQGGIIRHDLAWKDMRVFNIPTNVTILGPTRATNANSIFVIQAAQVCLAHLGHLHHRLGADQAREMGRIDVLFVPIDGTTTLSHEEALDVIETVQPRLVVPMHFIFTDALLRFARLAEARYKVKRLEASTIEVGSPDLPSATEVLILSPQQPF